MAVFFCSLSFSWRVLWPWCGFGYWGIAVSHCFIHLRLLCEAIRIHSKKPTIRWNHFWSEVLTKKEEPSVWWDIMTVFFQISAFEQCITSANLFLKDSALQCAEFSFLLKHGVEGSNSIKWLSFWQHLIKCWSFLYCLDFSIPFLYS